MECTQFANETAAAFQQIFELGGWNAVIWMSIGWSFGGGFSSVLNWFERRRVA